MLGRAAYSIRQKLCLKIDKSLKEYLEVGEGILFGGHLLDWG
jgi:hypothetical protein